MTVGDFFIPHDGGIWSVFLNILNIAFIIGGITFATYTALFTYREFDKRKRPEVYADADKAPKITLMKAMSMWFLCAGIIFVLCILSYLSNTVDISSEQYVELAGVLSFLDPILAVSQLAKEPFSKWFGVNLIFRVFIAYMLFACVMVSIRAFKKVAKEFSVFTKNKLLSISSDHEDSFIDVADEDGSESKPKDIEEANSQSIFKSLINKATILGLPTGGIAAYIFGGDKTQKSIKEILTVIQEIMDMVLFTGKLEPNASGVSSLLSNCFMVVLSIFVAAIYLSICAMLWVIISTIWQERTQVKGWLKAKRKQLWTIAGIAGAITLVTLSLFAVISGYNDIASAFNAIFATSDGFLAPLKILAYAMCTILCIGVLFLLTAFLVAFVTLVASFTFNTVKGLIEYFQKEKAKLLNIAKIVALLIVSVSLICIGILSYDSIKNHLMSMFIKNGSLSSIFVVIGFLVLFVLCIGAMLLFVSTLIFFTVSMLRGVYMLFKNYQIVEKMSHSIDSTFLILKKALFQALKILLLIPFTLKNGQRALKSLIETLLKVFLGYERESDKNRALFLAACFAAIASFINTFYGLKEFYHDNTSPLPVISSLFIAFAIQIAILICGMKAGEGLAERIISSRSFSKGGVFRAVTGKLFLCLAYLVTYITVIVLAFTKLKPDMIFWQVLLIIATGLAFLYAIIMQGAEIHKLLRNHKEDKEKGIVDFSYTFMDKPLHIPAIISLVAYALLLIVSIGFAYTNLFRYFADSANIKQNVYDEVKYQADATLGVVDSVADMANEYTSNINELLLMLESDIESTSEIKEQTSAALQARVDYFSVGDIARIVRENERDTFETNTADISALMASCKSVLNDDYETFGKVQLELYTYKHYWGEKTAPSNITHAIKVSSYMNPNDKRNVKEMFTVGQIIPTTNSDKITEVIINGENVGAFIDRYKSPASQSYSVSFETFQVNDADKYIVLREVYNVYKELRSIVYNTATSLNSGVKEGKQTNIDIDSSIELGISDQFFDLIDRNNIIDSIRGNLAKEWADSAKTNETGIPSGVNVNDLTHIVFDILPSISVSEHEEVENNEDNINGETEVKDLKFVELLNYIHVSTRLYYILQPYYLSQDGLKELNGQNHDFQVIVNSPASLEKGKTNRITFQDSPVELTNLDIVKIDAVTQEPVPKTKFTVTRSNGELVDTYETDNNGKAIVEGLEDGMYIIFEVDQTDENKLNDNAKIIVVNSKAEATKSGEIDDSLTEPILMTQRYLGYARSIKNSYFLLSLDVLLKGGFGLNAVKDKINAIYSSNIIALFLLLICAILDFMSFFVGLMVLKDIYLFNRNAKLDEWGYLTYDSALVRIFSMPKDRMLRRLHKAYIYSLLCDNITSTSGVTEWTEIFASEDFKNYAQSKENQLEELLIDVSKTENRRNLLLWLDSFIKEKKLKKPM